MKNARKAFTGVLGAMLDHGMKIPDPLRTGGKTGRDLLARAGAACGLPDSYQESQTGGRNDSVRSGTKSGSNVSAGTKMGTLRHQSDHRVSEKGIPGFGEENQIVGGVRAERNPREKGVSLYPELRSRIISRTSRAVNPDFLASASTTFQFPGCAWSKNLSNSKDRRQRGGRQQLRQQDGQSDDHGARNRCCHSRRRLAESRYPVRSGGGSAAIMGGAAGAGWALR